MSYNRNKNFIKKEKKRNPTYHVTKEGSLGLLALGDIGLDLWRQERNNNENTNENVNVNG